MDTEAQILEIVQGMVSSSSPNNLSIKEITSRFIEKHGNDYERKITTKWIGSLLRKKLHLKSHKSHGVFVISPSEKPKLERLYEKYRIGSKEGAEPVANDETLRPVATPRVDLGDVGDIERGYISRGPAEKPCQ